MAKGRQPANSRAKILGQSGGVSLRGERNWVVSSERERGKRQNNLVFLKFELFPDMSQADYRSAFQSPMPTPTATARMETYGGYSTICSRSAPPLTFCVRFVFLPHGMQDKTKSTARGG